MTYRVLGASAAATIEHSQGLVRDIGLTAGADIRRTP